MCETIESNTEEAPGQEAVTVEGVDGHKSLVVVFSCFVCGLVKEGCGQGRG